jgi:hypothetical protein
MADLTKLAEQRARGVEASDKPVTEA